MTARGAFYLPLGGSVLTVGVLTLGRLVRAGPTRVGSCLSLLCCWRQAGRVVGGVSLCVHAAEEAGEENEGEDNGEHEGRS
jgi:hypothetical protein